MPFGIFNSLPSQNDKYISCSRSCGASGVSRQIRSRAEKAFREAEEGQEKVTLDLLQRLETLNEERRKLSHHLNTESEILATELNTAQMSAFGSTFGCSEANRPLEANRSSPLRQKQVGSAKDLEEDRHLHISQGRPHDDPTREFYHRSQTTPKPKDTLLASVKYQSNRKRALTMHSSNPDDFHQPSTFLHPKSEENHFLRERMYEMESWAAEVHQVALKLREEVIELRSLV